ncbi:deoxynucleotidyltransferase terminal-interacting protein 2 [Eucyclogobius newberryi]|uniref:deoxynucleotidyltransferase terminal-interacting protein 2 n=1 Tax=Eucyclogobius newberryi TaxID=166745 RepID=UPI003B5C752B
MVATRRGVRVSSPSKSDSDQTSAAQATPSTGRRTRRTANPHESPTQTTVEEASSELQKITHNSAAPNSVRKRCTRAARLHSPDKPCTPVGSVHEGEISDLESSCSALSDIEAPVTCKTTRKQTRSVTKEEYVSEVESCSSVASAAKVRRSTRIKPLSDALDSASEVKDDKTEPEPYTPTVSQRSRRSRAARRPQIESEMSDTDSVTGDVPKSATRRSTRARGKPVVPLNLDDILKSSPSRKTRATSAKGESVSGPMSCDSEGFESGPSYSRATRAQRKCTVKVIDSDSDLTDIGKAETPSRSRTGSGSSSQQTPVLAIAGSNKSLCVVLEKTPIPPDGENLNDSRLESTVMDVDCTLIEEEDKKECITSAESEQADETPPAKSNTEESSINSHFESIPTTDESAEIMEDHQEPAEIIEDHQEPAEMAEDQHKPAVMAEDQKEELPAESMVEKASELEMMQETVEPSKPLESASVTTTFDSENTEVKDEDMEVANADADILDDNKKTEEGDDDVEMPEVDTMASMSVSGEVQQVVETVKESLCQIEEEQEEPTQGTSSQQHQTQEVQYFEQPLQGAVVQSKNAISLLDSSDDEDEDDFADEIGESPGDEEEDLETNDGVVETRKTEDSKAVDGLFMIDTRPGQETNEQYYKDRSREEAQAAQEADEEEEDDEFVDEEGDDDYDDDAADVLFSSRDPQAKALSSRIDPGLRMKELGGLYISFDGSKSKPVSSSQQKTKEKKIQDEVMQKSVIGPDFEKKDAVPPYNESKQALKLKRRAERAKTSGDAWFNVKAPEITQELKGDLQLLKMRGSMDPKRFYKKNDRDGFPKYFQMGTVVDSPVDFYHSRLSKKNRKRTMVEELLADAEFRQKNKKKFQTIMAEKAAQAAGGRRHKMKGKFHKK